MCLSLYEGLLGQSKQILEGVNILEKQGNHKSKLNITATKTKKKRTQALNKRKSSNQKKKKKKKGTREKLENNWESTGK